MVEGFQLVNGVSIPDVHNRPILTTLDYDKIVVTTKFEVGRRTYNGDEPSALHQLFESGDRVKGKIDWKGPVATYTDITTFNINKNSVEFERKGLE